MRRVLLPLACAALAAPLARAPVLEVAELNTEQIRGLDRARTAVILPGGILEEHGPYLPSYADGHSRDIMQVPAIAAVVQDALAREAATEARHQEWLRRRAPAAGPRAH